MLLIKPLNAQGYFTIVDFIYSFYLQTYIFFTNKTRESMENKTRPAELLPSTTTRGAGCAPKDPLWEMFPIFSNIQNLRNWRYLRALSIYSPADGAEEQQ
ncbi:MAG: hypothetical protein PUI88_09840, partial [Prevotella sp.]|nr:hypothetical protein [Prevotella sp.]